MGRLEIYVLDNQICCDVIYEGKRKNLDYNQMVELLKELTKESAPNLLKNGNGYMLMYRDVEVALRDYKRLIDNDENIAEYNKATFLKLEKKHAKDKLKNSNEKKVNRASSKTGIKVIASVAVIFTVLGTAKVVKAMNNMVERAKEPSISSQYVLEDNLQEDVFLEEPPVIQSVPDEDYTEIDRMVKEAEEMVREAPISQVNPANIIELELKYEDRSNDDKFETVKREYGELITKYANRYGLDPNLVMAIATQERGIHSETRDSGGAIGLMQIEGIWNNQSVSVYNFENKSYETIAFTEESLSNLENNIQAGCAILQVNCNYQKYNLPASIQSYNYGYGNMEKINDVYASNTGLSKTQILENPNDTGWMDYRYLANGGDEKYVEHVLSYLGENPKITFEKPDGTIIAYDVLSQNNVKSYS